MTPISIIGKNYQGKVKRTRVACRAIILRGDRILLSHETRHDLFMLPGGGLEAGERETDCCAREVAEETGLLFCPASLALTIDEYYGDRKYVSYYYTGTVTGTTATKLTKDEIEGGLVSRWLPLDEALALFGDHARYDGVYELKRGLYLREYTALSALLKGKT